MFALLTDIDSIGGSTFRWSHIISTNDFWSRTCFYTYQVLFAFVLSIRDKLIISFCAVICSFLISIFIYFFVYSFVRLCARYLCWYNKQWCTGIKQMPIFDFNWNGNQHHLAYFLFCPHSFFISHSRLLLSKWEIVLKVKQTHHNRQIYTLF